MGINRATLTGNVGKEPDLRFTTAGRARLEFSLATTQKWKDEKVGQKEATQWHRCVLWGPRAEALSKFIHKGSKLLVEGRIEYRSWDKPDGGKGYATEINVNELELLDSPRTSSEQSGPPRGHKAMDEIGGEPMGQNPPRGDEPEPEAPPYIDDIPF